MATNVAITRNNNENSASVLRRFQKKVRGAGFMQTVRDNRYYSCQSSKLRAKNSKLVSLARGAAKRKAIKEGKVQEKDAK